MPDQIRLYKVPRNSLINYEGNTLKFHHIDGMYSYCTTLDDEVVHLAAMALVTVIKTLNEEDN